MLFTDVVLLTAFAVSAATETVPVPAQLLGAAVTAAALIGNNLVMRRRVSAPA
ncbi:hypothetical protein ACFPM7_00995 [Actinokineospora guangxiensis]|uniref:Uncharacterized protein n=1 Tax=Actinokineospora guangxiensis TaxID=1490288 RepID=A0ABW0EI85_9PSEU